MDNPKSQFRSRSQKEVFYPILPVKTYYYTAISAMCCVTCKNRRVRMSAEYRGSASAQCVSDVDSFRVLRDTNLKDITKNS